MTKKDIIELYNFLVSVKDKEGTAFKFKYAVAKILNQLEGEIGILRNLEIACAQIIEPLNNKKNELIKKYGKEVGDGQNFSISPEDTNSITKFNEEFKVLQEENKEIVEKYNGRLVELEIIKDEKIIIDLYCISYASCPEWITIDEIRMLDRLNILIDFDAPLKVS